MRKIANAGVIVLSLLTAACNTTSGTTTAVVTVEKPVLVIPQVDQLKLKDIDWLIISKKAKPQDNAHIDQVFKRSNSTSLFALSPQDYEDSSVNTANMLKTIRQLQAQVQAYREYYSKEQHTNATQAPVR